ncbi:MAG: FHA domain-containing protein [Myxococcota bacterium]
MNTNPAGPANSTTPPQDAGGGQAVASPSEPLPFESTSQLPTDSVHSSNAFAASSAVAKLVVIRPDGSEGATIPMHEGELIIGRSSEHEALAGDPFLSPQHASIKIRDSKFMINDLDSLNGIFYRIRGECELVSGDNIRMGQELLVFELMSEVPLLHEHAEGDDAETLGGGSPDVGYWGRLSLISGPDLVSRAFTFSEDEVTLGRERGDILFRDDGFVSGVHARLMKVDSQVLLKDLGSSNGTYVRIRKERELEDGDLILMGQQLFRLVA